MIRTQIQLELSQVARLKRYCSREGISLAEAIRRCIDSRLPDTPRDTSDWDAAGELVGAFEDRRGARDLARNHDAYLDEALD